jgi:hypothetical protein
MGRPLNKKYFGNRNIGTGGDQTIGTQSNSQNYADDRIGGEGVASYGTIVAGSGWTATPTVTFSPPDISGGVSVGGIVRYKALSFAVTANGTGYNIGNVLEVDTGTQTTKARAIVESVKTVTATVANGGTGWAVGDTWTVSGPGWVQALQVTVATISGAGPTGPAATVTIVQEGRRDVTAPTNPVGITSAITAAGGGTYNLDLTWGVYAFGTVSVAGSYTTFPSTGGAGTLTSVSPATGTGAKADITMGLLSVTVTEKGSGYTTPADAAVTFGGSTGAAATAVLTTDTGAVGSATNQENAIVIRANTSAGGTTALVGDIIRQVSTRRYKVKTADGIKVCQLGTDDTPAPAGAYIKATDDNGNTYFVTKLTAHRATLVQWNDAESGPWLFNDNESAPWTFGSTTETTVQIENA